MSVIPNNASGVQPVQNNQAVLPMRQTTPNPLEILSTLQSFNFQVPTNIIGYSSPIGAGIVPIVDINGNQVLIPDHSLILAVGMETSENVLDSGVTINIQTIETVPQVIYAAKTAAEINVGIFGGPTLGTLGTTTIGLSSLVTGTVFTPRPQIKYNIYVISMV